MNKGTSQALTDSPENAAFGLKCWRGQASHMPRPHRHDDVEVNIATGGGLPYVFAGELSRSTVQLVIKPRQTLNIDCYNALERIDLTWTFPF